MTLPRKAFGMVPAIAIPAAGIFRLLTGRR